MSTENGKAMTQAIRAVLAMQSDCIHLFRDLDASMHGLESVFGNVVTLNLGSTINKGGHYLAQGLIRLYSTKSAPESVLGINICFYPDGKEDHFEEPVLIVANAIYQPGTNSPAENLKRGWDPWYGFLVWGADRAYNKRISIQRPAKRPTIEKIDVAAMPLYEVTKLSQVLALFALVRPLDKLT